MIQQVACPCTGEEFRLLVLDDGSMVGHCVRCQRVGVKFEVAGDVVAALHGDAPPEITRIEYLDPRQLSAEGIVAEPQTGPAPLRDEHGQIWPKPLPTAEEKRIRNRGVAVRFEGGPWAGKTQRFPADVDTFYIGSMGSATFDMPAGSGWGHDVPDEVKKAPHYVEAMVDQDGTKVFTWTEEPTPPEDNTMPPPEII